MTEITEKPSGSSSPPTLIPAARPVTTKGPDWMSWASWGVLALLLVFFPFVAGKQWLAVGVFGLIISIGSLSLNILAGYTGLASLGHAFFLGIGAYTSTYLGLNLNWNFLIWLPLAGLVAGFVGLVIGFVTLRFHGFYLSIVTLGLVFIGDYIFLNWKSISGGSTGRKTPAPALGDFSWANTGNIGPLELTRDQKYYFLVLLILIVIVVFVKHVLSTRMGRAFQAVRDREIAAALLGINVARTRIISFVFSTFLAGICGALYASYLSYIQPNQWDLNFSIQLLAMVIIGGIATVSGSIVGAIFLVALPQLIDSYINFLPFIQQGAGTGGITTTDFKEILYAIFLSLFLIFEQGGLMGIYRRIKARVLKSKLGKYFI